MKTEVEIVSDTAPQSCYRDMRILARLYIHVADEINATQMTTCDFPSVDAAIRGGWQKENLAYTEIPHLCQILHRTIDVLTAYEAEAASHHHMISGPYWEPD